MHALLPETALPVDLAPMGDSKNYDQQHCVANLVDDSMVPDSDPIAVQLSRELFYTRRPRVGGQAIHRGANASLNFEGKAFEVAQSGWAQLDLVGHPSESKIRLDTLPRNTFAWLGERRVGRGVIDPVLFFLAESLQQREVLRRHEDRDRTSVAFDGNGLAGCLDALEVLRELRANFCGGLVGHRLVSASALTHSRMSHLAWGSIR